MKQEPALHVRWMVRRNISDVLRIEDESFEFPWPEEDFIRTLRQRNCIGMVAVDERSETPLHLLSLAVEPESRRRGVGKALVDKLIAKLAEGRRNTILTEVRERNLAAQLFFRAQGFRAVRVLRDFYEDGAKCKPSRRRCNVELRSSANAEGQDRIAHAALLGLRR